MRRGIIQYRTHYPWWLAISSILLILFYPSLMSRNQSIDLSMIAEESRVAQAFQKYLNHGHAPELIAAIIKQESSGRSHIVSCKGAVGLMQVMPSTAKFLGLPHSKIALKNPVINKYVGSRILSYYMKKHNNDLSKALHDYSGGAKNYYSKVMKHKDG